MSVDAGQQQSRIRTASSTISLANRWDHFLARWAFRRNRHRVEPGLYAIGSPSPASPVFVTANYTLSFDALRSALAGFDGYILVLDTDGVNVWCAAGKGTFGTEELVRRIAETNLERVVTHRQLILPQLGAPGVAAHEVKGRTGFQVEYGPVRAGDLPKFLEEGRASPEMRRVRFTLLDRFVLIPVELVAALVPMLVATGITSLVGGVSAGLAVLAAFLAGVVLAPLMLPWIPTHDFTTKGLLVGFLAVLPFGLWRMLGHSDESSWLRVIQGLSYLVALPAVTAFMVLNFTGSSTFTSKTGVKQEIFSYVPVLAGMLVIGLFLTIAARAMQSLGGL